MQQQEPFSWRMAKTLDMSRAPGVPMPGALGVLVWDQAFEVPRYV
jgi:hypothetical protein